MAQTYGFETPITHDQIAWTLHAWYAALDAVSLRPEAELYACAEEIVVDYLSNRHTFDELLRAFSAPDPELTRLIAELCTEGEILLRPHLLLGASCALRLRQLVWETGA
jgi:hypothetical protein